MSGFYLGNLEPGARYIVDRDGRPVKTKSSRTKQVLQGSCCHYGVEHTNYKTGQREIFLPGVFNDSLRGVIFLRDHILTEPKMADQDDSDLELHDCEAGLAVRVHLKEGMLDRLEGREQLSVGYHVLESCIRTDGVRLIKHAVLIEVSAVHVGAVRQTFLEIRDADDVGPLETDSKNFAGEGAAKGFLRALRNLDTE
jgi:hypothetical protein